MPDVLTYYDLDDPGYLRIRIRGCLWPADAWDKGQRSSMRAVKLLSLYDPIGIGVVYPPEVASVTFATSHKARGTKSDWEIVFEAPGGWRGRISDAVRIVRERVVGEFVDDELAGLEIARSNTIKQVLTTTGNGPRRSRGGRRDEMSSTLYPSFRFKNGLYDILFTKDG
mgnify:CR=1 FL=1